MAYITTMTDVTSIQHLYSTICSKISDMGQTLHDTIDTSTSVYKSNGEDGARIYEYIKIRQTGTSLYCEPFGQWDATAHSGHTNNPGQSYLYFTYHAYTCHIYGSKNLVAIRMRDMTTNSACAQSDVMLFGHFDKRTIDKPHTTITSPITAGYYVVIPVADTTGFKLLYPPDANNSAYMIQGANGEGRAWVRPIGIGASDLTVYYLGVDFTTGAIIGQSTSTFGATGHNTRNFFHFNHQTAAQADGTGAPSPYNGQFYCHLLVGLCDPDANQNLYVLQPIHVPDYGNAPFAYSDSSILTVPTSTDWELWAINDDATSKGATYLSASAYDSTSTTDAAQSWGTDALIGKCVVIYTGVGSGQSRKIQSNTSTKITFNAQKFQPDATSRFMIVDEVYRTVNTTGFQWGCKELF